MSHSFKCSRLSRYDSELKLPSQLFVRNQTHSQPHLNKHWCSPIVCRVFLHCFDSWFQMVVSGGGSVVGNAGIFYLQSPLGL
jgi:hypothetical protein